MDVNVVDPATTAVATIARLYSMKKCHKRNVIKAMNEISYSSFSTPLSFFCCKGENTLPKRCGRADPFSIV
jgi:hypothetical protein